MVSYLRECVEDQCWGICILHTEMSACALQLQSWQRTKALSRVFLGPWRGLVHVLLV